MLTLAKKKTLTSYLHTRALLYTLESLPLPYIYKLLSGNESHLPTRTEQLYAIGLIKKIIAADAKDYIDGYYSLKALLPEKRPHDHLYRWADVLVDGAVASFRRRNNQTKEFSSKADSIADLPNYYKRNFHHQTDGYLSDNSAKRYDHQVEILFRGLANPMRRRLIRPVIDQIGNNSKVRILELACGTGTFTKILAESFPQAHITAVDLSPSYISHARKRLASYKNVHFMTGNAEDLPFKDKHFDACVSVFLHHELPEKNRFAAIQESLRLTAPGGFCGLLDSIQWDDDPELNRGLANFPKTFHEPFYTNYIKVPLKSLFKKCNSQLDVTEETHFVSKAVYTVPK